MNKDDKVLIQTIIFDVIERIFSQEKAIEIIDSIDWDKNKTFEQLLENIKIALFFNLDTKDFEVSQEEILAKIERTHQIWPINKIYNSIKKF